MEYNILEYIVIARSLESSETSVVHNSVWCCWVVEDSGILFYESILKASTSRYFLLG